MDDKWDLFDYDALPDLSEDESDGDDQERLTRQHQRLGQQRLRQRISDVDDSDNELSPSLGGEGSKIGSSFRGGWTAESVAYASFVYQGASPGSLPSFNVPQASSRRTSVAQQQPSHDGKTSKPFMNDDLGSACDKGKSSALMKGDAIQHAKDLVGDGDDRTTRLVSVLVGDGKAFPSIDFPDFLGEPPPEPAPQLPPIAQLDPDQYKTGLSPGGMVKICGLQSRPELNGQAARILLHDVDEDRLEVELCDKAKEHVRCKSVNLQKLDDGCLSKWAEAAEAHRRGYTRKAIELYIIAILIAGHKWDVLTTGLHIGLSLAYTQCGKHQRAKQSADDAISQRPGWSKCHALKGYVIAKACESIKRRREEDEPVLVEAQRSYISAVERDPTCEESLLGLWVVSERLFRVGIVTKEEAEADKRQKHAAQAMEEGRLPLAIALWTVAHATLMAASRKTYKHRGSTCMWRRSAAFAQLTEWERSLRDVEEAISLSPFWGRPHAIRGVALQNLGHAERAYTSFHLAGTREKDFEVLVLECQRALWQIPRLESPLARQRQQRFNEDAHKPKGSCRIFAISDVHIDQSPSVLKWAEDISKNAYQNDILLVAGDLGDTYNAIKRGLTIFKDRFRRVFYVPGNHDLWIRPNTIDALGFQDSVLKLLTLIEFCDHIGVEMMPAQVMEDVYIAPMLSWWSYTFDVKNPFPNNLVYDSFCRWPMGDHEAHKFFLRWNESAVRSISASQAAKGHRGEVISFSHFLPCHEIMTANAPQKASGCLELEQQITSIKSSYHIFGHTHRNFEYECRGVTYQQHSLMSPTYDYSDGMALLKVHDGCLRVGAAATSV